jgi:hypothetical protein
MSRAATAARPPARRASLLAGLLSALAACRLDPSRRAAPAASPAPKTVIHDEGIDGAASPDASDGATVARCPSRASPPHDLSLGTPVPGSAAITWNGREWGVAWTELQGEMPAVFFARVGKDGRRRGMPVRVSERGYRGSTPAVAWNGESWNVAFSGGASALEEIWLGRIDARGAPMGRPQRVTARDRRDFFPALAFDGRNLVLAWSAVTPERRHAVLALRMNRWGSQLGPPVRLADRRERLSSPVIVANGAGWGLAWLVSRTEALAVDMARLDAEGNARGYPARVTLGTLGGSDLVARFGVAWDGARYGLAWDEVRDGAPHVFFDTIDRRLDTRGRAVMLSAPGDAATAPALLALGPDAFLAAWEVEREGGRHVQLAAFDGAGTLLHERIEVQGHDGRAMAPSLAVGDGEVGLATVTPRAVSFHRIPLGPCLRAP